MNKRNLAVLFLCMCLGASCEPCISIMEVRADTEDGKDGFWDNTFLGQLIGNIKDIFIFINDKVPDKEMSILDHVMDQTYEMTVYYQETKKEDGKEELKKYRKYFDLELYKNEYNIISSAGGTITGTEIAVPSTLQQSGLCKDDFTNINYVPGSWVDPCKTVFDLWKSLGSQSDRGIATINGYYLVAVRPQFGNVGDIIGIHLEDGTEINCLIMDTKGEDADEWGHMQNGGYSLVEWEADGGHKGQVSGPAKGVNIDLTDWEGKKVTSIVNGGPYVDGITEAGGAGAATAHKATEDDPYYRFKSIGDESGISEVGKAFKDTKWASLDNLVVGFGAVPSVKANISEDLEPYVNQLEEAAKKHGFIVYKELFKAVAQCRHMSGDPDIFRMEDTDLNPNPGNKVSTEVSIELAARLFSQCLEAANYPNPAAVEDLKALLQAFEFGSTEYITKYENKYSLVTAEAYAADHCNGKKRTNAGFISACGQYDYRDQKFPPKVLKYYSVISFSTADMPASEQELLMEALAGWPSDLDERRKAVIEKGLSLYGKITYSMNHRGYPSLDAPAYLDCSSYVGWSFEEASFTNVQSSWTTASFINQWKFITRTELIPGDVALLRNTQSIYGENHIGIYIGKSSTGSNVWLHCTGFHQGAPVGLDGKHTLNRGIMITDDSGRVEGYSCGWTVFMRNPLLGNR